MDDAWYEEIVRGLCVGLLSGGTVKILSDTSFTGWSFTTAFVGVIGLTVLSYVRLKRNKKCEK